MASIWDDVTRKTTAKLNDSGISLMFNAPKNDESHVKAKAGVSCCYWAFAKNQENLWVELELKPRTVDGLRVPQDELFETFRKKKVQIQNDSGLHLDLSTGGNDRRISCYISKGYGVGRLNSEECSEKMFKFVVALHPILHSKAASTY